MNKGADRIFVGGPIVTIDPRRPQVEALAVIGERIFALGRSADIMRYRTSATEIVDLAGATLMPGFVEAHGHPIMTGAAWGDPVVDIRAIHTPTYAAAVAKIRRRVAKAKPGEHLWFIGLDPALHQGMREPTTAELDALAPNNPICIQTSNFHVVYANTAAVRQVSNAADIPVPKGGQIHKDKASGQSWKFQEGATTMLRESFLRQHGSERLEREANAWMWHYAHSGYTTTTELGSAPGWSAIPARTVWCSRAPSPARISRRSRGSGSARVAVR